jgi:hypothetical protein
LEFLLSIQPIVHRILSSAEPFKDLLREFHDC